MSETEKRKREEYRQVRKRRICIIAVITAICLLCTAVLFALYYQLNKTYYIDYTEKGTVDYRVQLKPNEFYQDAYLGSGQAYISSLIEAVEANFYYALETAAGDVNYEYSYRVDGQLKITDNSSEEPLYAPIQEIKPAHTLTQNSSNMLEIREHVRIDYSSYNEHAQKFISTYQLSNASAELILRMHINVLSTCAEFEENTQNEYVVALHIPLVSKTLSIEMTTNVPETESKILACDREFNRELLLYTALGLSGVDVLLLIALVLFIYLTRNTDITYAIKVRRLLNAYRSYIQQINNAFDLSPYQVLQVNSFNEMLEIRDTIQSPILMHENEDRTRTQFIIPTNNRLLYLFEIKVDDYDELYRQSKEQTPPVTADAPAADETPAPLPLEDTLPEIASEAVATQAEASCEEPEREASTEVELTPMGAEAEMAEEGEDGFDFGAKYDYSFEARLALASDDVKSFYRQIVSFACSFGVKVARSWKRERIYLGRRLFALLAFRGKKQVIALALDPAVYAQPKYHAADMSGVKKYEKTPMLMRISSARKAKYAIELLSLAFANAGLEDRQLQIEAEPIPHKSKKTLVLEGLIKTDLHPDEIPDHPVYDAPAKAIPEADSTTELEDTTAVHHFISGSKNDYSFEAKLSLSSDQVKDFYRRITDFARSYGVKVVRSWQRERIYKGRELFAILLFKGQKLVVALATDPAKLDAKYHAKDMSGTRKYERTPALLRVTSERKVKYTIELLTAAFTEAGLTAKKHAVSSPDIPSFTKEELLEKNLIRVQNKSVK